MQAAVGPVSPRLKSLIGRRRPCLTLKSGTGRCCNLILGIRAKPACRIVFMQDATSEKSASQHHNYMKYVRTQVTSLHSLRIFGTYMHFPQTKAHGHGDGEVDRRMISGPCQLSCVDYSSGS